MRTLKEEYKKKINDFRDDVEEMIKHRFMDDKVIHPVVFGLVIKEDKLVMTVLMGLGELFASEDGKEQAAEIIRKMNKEIKPVALAFVSEGWMAAVKKEEDVLDKNGKYLSENHMPRNNPDKKEVLMMMFETHDEEVGIFLEIKRIGELVEIEDMKGTSKEWMPKSKKDKGRFSNLLQENYSEINQLLEKILSKKETLN